MKKIYIILFFIIFGNEALAQNNPNETAINVEKFINNLGNKIIKIAADNKISDNIRKDKIINEVDLVIDSEWIARFVLGKNYKSASDAQKTRFSELYRQFMINTYGPKFKNYNGKKFNVVSVEQQNGFYVAKCEFLPRDSSAAINVQFRVKDRDGKLLVLDFVTEGISLIETQRSEFNSAISEKGMDKFIDDLAIRVKELKLRK